VWVIPSGLFLFQYIVSTGLTYELRVVYAGYPHKSRCAQTAPPKDVCISPVGWPGHYAAPMAAGVLIATIPFSRILDL
jgi:hypothetical protein